MGEWKLEALRLSTFLADQARPKQLEQWLTDVTRKEPAIQKNAFVFQGLCTVEDVAVQLTWQPSRIDWNVTPASPEARASIGGVDDINTVAEKYFTPFLASPDCPDSVRLAVGAALIMPATDAEEAHDVLRGLLRPVTIPKNTRDLLYRVNRPKHHEELGLTVNRLATWSAATRQHFTLVLPTQVAQLPVASQPDDAFMCCTLNLDINTVQQDGLLIKSSAQVKTVGVLRSTAIDIVCRGDLGE